MNRVKRTPSKGLSFPQRVALTLFGRSHVGEVTRPGWSGSLPVYAFRCPKHGLVTNYEQGYDRRLDCPICQRELLKARPEEAEAPDEGLYNTLSVGEEYTSQLFTTIR